MPKAEQGLTHLILKRRVALFGRSSGLMLAAMMLQPSDDGIAQSLQDGLDAYLRGEYSLAFEVLLPAATDENPRLQNLVGVMIYEGKGTQPDAAAARDLFRNAANTGVADARRNLGILYSIGGDGVPVNYDRARAWFTIGAAAAFKDVAEPDSSAPVLPREVRTVIPMGLKEDPLGQNTFLVFCAGCHGFDGMHLFVHAPSFAMSERMTSGDEELMRSILHGKGMMPA